MSSKDLFNYQKKLIKQQKKVIRKTSEDDQNNKIAALTEAIFVEKMTYNKEKANYDDLSFQIIDKEMSLDQIEYKTSNLKKKLLLSFNMINITFLNHFHGLYYKIHPNIIEGMWCFFGCEVANSYLMEKISQSPFEMNNMIEMAFLFQRKKNDERHNDPYYFTTKKKILQITEEHNKSFLYPYDILYNYFHKIYDLCEEEIIKEKLITTINILKKEKVSCYKKMLYYQKEMNDNENRKMILLNQIQKKQEDNTIISYKRLPIDKIHIKNKIIPTKNIITNNKDLLNKAQQIKPIDKCKITKQLTVQSSSRKNRMLLIKNHIKKPMKINMSTEHSLKKSIDNSDTLYKYLTRSTNTNVHSQSNSLSHSRMTTYSKEKKNDNKQLKKTIKSNLFKSKIPNKNNIKLVKIQDQFNKNTRSVCSSANHTQKNFKESLLGQPTKRTISQFTTRKNSEIFTKFKDEILIECTQTEQHMTTDMTHNQDQQNNVIKLKDANIVNKEQNNDIITKGTKELDSECCISCT